MSGMIEYISIFNSIFEIWSIILISEGIAGDKTARMAILKKVAFVLVMTCVVLVNIFQLNRIFLMSIYLIIFVMIKIGYKIKVVDAFLYAVFSILFVSIIELSVYTVFFVLSLLVLKGADVTSLVVLITFIISFLVKRKGLLLEGKKLFYQWKGNTYLIYASIILLLLLAINSIRFKGTLDFSEVVSLIAVMAIFLITVYKIGNYRMEIDLHKKYTEKYSEVISEIRARQHKFMNQLDSIYRLSEVYDSHDELVEKQKKGINNLKDYILPNKILILDCPMVIAHIYSKMCEAEKKGIELNTDFSCSLQGSIVPDVFLIEIIGNLLDNAMDEVELREKKEKILFSITPTEKGICISVSNEHDKIKYESYKDFFKQGFSTKGKNRGVGLPYVKKIIEKYDGNIEIGNIDIEGTNYFYIKVFLGVKEQE